MDVNSFAKILFLLFLNISIGSSFNLEPGIYQTNITLRSNQSSSLFGFIKNMFEDTYVALTINEAECDEGTNFKVEWLLRYSDCYGLYSAQYEQNKNTLDDLWSTQKIPFMFPEEDMIDMIRSSEGELRGCDTQTPLPYKAEGYTCYSRMNTTHCTYVPRQDTETADETEDEDDKPPAEDTQEGNADNDMEQENEGAEPNEDTNENEDETNNDTEPEETENKPSRRRKRAAENAEEEQDGSEEPKKSTVKPVATVKPTEAVKKLLKNSVTKTTMAGSYIFILKVTVAKGKVYNLSVKIEMKSKHGFLSAYQYPLLKFYGVMCGVYSILAFTWLLLMARQWRELLGIQFWIGGVIILGLIEKAVFYAEYEHMNNDGIASSTGLIFPELVSCMKRTLARLLVIIVSIGYGITRPRLGQDFHWLMIAGGLYFVLSSLEAVLRVTGNAENEMIAVLPLSVLDAVIVWWIFKNLVDTTRTLRLRRNITKLWLYRHFTNALILCIIFSLAYFLWQFKMHRLVDCVKNWSELWLDDAFWHILFCVILVTIMILLRPSVNNQRYAYSPLGDEEGGDDESKDPMLSEAYDGMKMRNVRKDDVKAYKDADDDLKWVEDNIPAAIADTALATFDDSEEELVTNLERSKME